MNRFVNVVMMGFLVLALSLGLWGRREMPRRVSVGEHELRVLVQGRGGPAVVFESFGAAYLEHMSRVQSAVAEWTTTVNYDHAGNWGSEPGPKPRDANRVAEELHTLLSRAGVAPPYILVGFSFGGPYSRVFAARYPDEVAGMVLIDPTQESFMRWLRASFPEVNRLTEEQRQSGSEWGSQLDSMAQAEAAVLPEIPIVLITAMKTSEGVFGRHVRPLWLQAHADWLSAYPDAEHVVTYRSGHGVPLSEPQMVIEAIRRVHARAQAKLDSAD